MKKNINTNCRLNWSFWLSIFAIVISLTTIILFFCKVNSNSVVDISTFIGIIAAFIGISVTLVIGFQIYSFISIKDKINEMNSLKNELTETEKEVQKTKNNIGDLENELKGIIRSSECRSYIERKDFCSAFCRLQFALVYFIDLDSKKEDLNSLINILDYCFKKVKKEDFETPTKNKTIDNIISKIEKNHSKIQKGKYYWVIRNNYDKIYSDFLNKIESFKTKNN